MKIRKSLVAVAGGAALVASSALLVAPANAASTQVVNASLGSSVTMTANVPDVTTSAPWTLASTGANTRAGGSVTVNSNAPYTLTVSSDKASLTAWDTSLNSGAGGYVASSPKSLTAPLTVSGTRSSGTAVVPGVAAAAVTGVSTLLATGTGLGTDVYDVSFSQPTLITDSALPTGHYYHAVLTYTASSTL